MAEFDMGEREDSCAVVQKTKGARRAKIEESKGEGDQLMLNTPQESSDDVEIIDTTTPKIMGTVLTRTRAAKIE